MTSLFPYDKVRSEQDRLMSEIDKTVESGGSCLIHAPTGLGKTAASLAPAIEYALAHDKIVFFLTSRHTQHKIAIDTIREIKEKHGVKVVVSDIIGKQGLCGMKGVESLRSREFADYCRTVREEGSCDFYKQTRSKNSLSPKGQELAARIKNDGPFHAEEVKSECVEKGLCPYEVLMNVSEHANVIVADYYYVFNTSILNLFLGKIGRGLDDCILIIDEGHNLGGRIRELSTSRLTDFVLSRAIKEAEKLEMDTGVLLELGRFLESERLDPGKEVLVKRHALMDVLKKFGEYDDIIELLSDAAEEIKLKKKRSMLASVAAFLAAWKGGDEGFTRILSSKQGKKGYKILSYRCMDPSLYTREIIEGAHASVLMSGTLVPLEMYQDILGFGDDARLLEFDSPFPTENRLNLIIPKTTTRYAKRTDEQFMSIAGICAGITNAIPGNIAIFFPSYLIRDRVLASFQRLSEKTIFSEVSGMQKEEKQEMIESFKSYKKAGAVLTGVASGSFGEGIDLPGDLLKGVVIVGLPLQVPDLETKQLIEYYDLKFSKGWDYGYVLPAITKSLQNAGRCIRSEDDKGIIIFLEERFAWDQYRRCFPKDWKIEVSLDFQNRIRNFLSF